MLEWRFPMHQKKKRRKPKKKKNLNMASIQNCTGTSSLNLSKRCRLEHSNMMHLFDAMPRQACIILFGASDDVANCVDAVIQCLYLGTSQSRVGGRKPMCSEAVS